jgi:hypothetical protein
MPKSFIGFFDILGFKELVERNSHERLLKIYEEALYFNINEIARIGLELHDDEVAKFSLNQIKKLVISDSIIFVQEDVTHRGLFFLILQSKVLLTISMQEGIPLRGAISIGEISIFETMGTTLLGKGLTNAYKLEASQEWSGAIVDPKCFELHPNDKQFLFILMHKLGAPLLLPYEIPVKHEKKTNELAINWVGIDDKKGKIRKSFTRHHKQINSDKERQIVDNTIQFVTYAQKVNLQANAVAFFNEISKQFGVSLEGVEDSDIDRMCSINQKDSWTSYLLRSKHYQEKIEDDLVSIVYIGTQKKIAYKCKDGSPNAEKINSKLLDKLKKSFNSFKRITKPDRLTLINQLLNP